MSSDAIEQLRKKFTDQYVAIAVPRADLRRFADRVGEVKTINTNGRALVQFLGPADRAWYDIDPECLRIVDKPPEPPPEKPAEKKPPAAKEKAAPKEATPAAAAAKAAGADPPPDAAAPKS